MSQSPSLDNEDPTKSYVYAIDGRGRKLTDLIGDDEWAEGGGGVSPIDDDLVLQLSISLSRSSQCRAFNCCRRTPSSPGITHRVAEVGLAGDLEINRVRSSRGKRHTISMPQQQQVVRPE